MTSPTPTPPCLGEREAVARIVERNLNQTAWPFAYRAERATDAIIAQHIQPLRTENETLRDERDAAAKEVTSALGQLRHLYPIVRRMNEELADGLLAPEIRSLEKLHRALTPEPPHGD